MSHREGAREKCALKSATRCHRTTIWKPLLPYLTQFHSKRCEKTLGNEQNKNVVEWKEEQREEAPNVERVVSLGINSLLPRQGVRAEKEKTYIVRDEKHCALAPRRTSVHMSSSRDEMRTWPETLNSLQHLFVDGVCLSRSIKVKQNVVSRTHTLYTSATFFHRQVQLKYFSYLTFFFFFNYEI